MAWQGTVRVVLGEAAEPYPGPLRLALLGARIDVVGQASNTAELERVLEGVQPEALVLDAQMGALAVLAARERSPGSGIVVVWPAGVSAEIADERVEPSRVVHELGPAVRRVARARAQPPAPVEAPAALLATVGAAASEPVQATSQADAPVDGSPVDRERVRRRDLWVLGVAASFVLLVVGAFALSRSPGGSGVLAGPPASRSASVAPSPSGGVSPGPTASPSPTPSPTPTGSPSPVSSAPSPALVGGEGGTSPSPPTGGSPGGGGEGPQPTPSPSSGPPGGGSPPPTPGGGGGETLGPPFGHGPRAHHGLGPPGHHHGLGPPGHHHGLGPPGHHHGLGPPGHHGLGPPGRHHGLGPPGHHGLGPPEHHHGLGPPGHHGHDPPGHE